jgi:apolipoprotein N-acyltransferase
MPVAKPARFFNEVKPPLGDALALLAGLIMPLGFAPFEWRFVPFMSLALLLVLLGVPSPRRAFFRGCLFGLGMFGLGVSWVYNSLHDFGGAAMPVAAAIAAGLVILNAAYIGLFGYLMRRWSPAVPDVYRNLLLFPAAWVFIEWLRSWLFTGFPWLLVGYSQVDTWLGGYAPVGGALTVSLMTAAVAGAAVTLIGGKAGVHRLAAAGVLLLVMVLGALLGMVRWTGPLGDPIRVALVQGNIPQDEKMKPENLALNLSHYYQLTRPHYDSSDLIIWPETAIPTFRHRVGDFLQALNLELEEHGTDLLTGVFVLDFDSRRYYNSVFKVGDERSVYYKRHLVPFGEYMPLRGLLEFLNNFIRIPMSDIAAGEGFRSLHLAGYEAAASICYESAYPDVFRNQLPGAAFLINVSNDAWFGDSLAPHQHLEIARMRALETGRYLLRATNTGISAIIDPQGRITARSPQFEVDVLTGQIQPMQGYTPFVRCGRTPLAVVLALILAAGERSRRRFKTAR